MIDASRRICIRGRKVSQKISQKFLSSYGEKLSLLKLAKGASEAPLKV